MSVALGLLFAGATEARAAFPGEPGRVAVTDVGAGFGGSSLYTLDPGAMAAPNQVIARSPDLLLSSPGWSADGTRLTWTIRDDDAGTEMVVVANSDGSARQVVVGPTAVARNSTFAPEGDRLAFVCAGPGGSTDICSASLPGPSSGTPLITGPQDEGAPMYSRGGVLFFVRDDGGDSEIWLRDTDGSQRQLTSNSVDDIQPDPLPDGRRLAFVRSSPPSLVIASTTGAEEASLPGVRTPFALSPDGQELVHSALDRMDAVRLSDGARRHITSSGVFWHTGLSWQPIPVTCGGSTATQVGTPGEDTLIGTEGDDVIAGLGGDDVVTGEGGKDVICGGDGDDRLIGGNSNDQLLGGGGEDTLKGGRGKDTLKGNRGKDKLKGGRGKDKLKGGRGKDRLSGGKGRDKLFGGKGADRLNGGKGRKDRCVGGKGRDRAKRCEREKRI